MKKITLLTLIYCIFVSLLYLCEFKKPTLTEIEKSLFKLINEEREKFNLKPLKYSPKLSIIANKHSKDIGRNKRNFLIYFLLEKKGYYITQDFIQ